jgi:hypothetical protein
MQWVLALVLAGLFVVELLVIVARRLWVNRKVAEERRREEVAGRPLALALVAGTELLAAGATQRRALRRAALALLLEIDGSDRARLTGILEQQGLVVDACRDLSKRSTFTRRQAADELAEVRSTDAIPALSRGLDDRDGLVRLFSARALAHLGARDRLPRIMEVVQKDGNLNVLAAAGVLRALAHTSPDALDRLEEVATPLMLRLAALAQVEAGQRAPTELFGRDLTGADPVFASIAVLGLGLSGGPAAADALATLINDPHADPALRADAADARAAATRR